jgi:hypothetical protein
VNGCWASEQERTASASEPGPAAMSGVDPMEGVLGHGPDRPNQATGDRALAWQRAHGRRAGVRTPSEGLESPLPALLRDRGRQRSWPPVSLSQPKGAEGLQPGSGSSIPSCCAGQVGPKSPRGDPPQRLRMAAAARTVQPTRGSRSRSKVTRDMAHDHRA